MTTKEVLSKLQQRVEAGEVLNAEELREATSQAVRFLVFSVSSGASDQLGPFSSWITQLTAAYFQRGGQEENVPREWARSLAIVGQIGVMLYESMAPTAEVQKILGRSQHAKKIARILVSRGSIQAKELRECAAIPHQPTLARIIHALANARIVTVQQGPGNTAWYRLTPEGGRLLRSAVLSADDMPVSAELEVAPLPGPASLEPVLELAHKLTRKLEDMRTESRPESHGKTAKSRAREESKIAAG